MMSIELIKKEIGKALNIDGSGIFGIARVIGRNDHTNRNRVRIYPLSQTKDFAMIEHTGVEDHFPFAETLSMAKGENHGIYYVPEFGDFVLYTQLPTGFYIMGSVLDPSWKFSGVNMPVEAQNMQRNGKEYNTAHYPDLTTKGYHLAMPNLGDDYQPASYL